MTTWWQRLELPGVINIHTHFMPERMLRRVRAHFDEAGPLIGRPWPIEYRWNQDSRLAHLRQTGVHRFTALTYAHRPGMAADLTDFALKLSAAEPDCVPSATFFPEDGVLDQVRSALELGARVFKIHAQVGGFDLREPALDKAWGLLADAAVPVVIHVASAPVARTSFTGPDAREGVLQRHPHLTAVVAHLGAPEYAEFLTLADRPRVHLDTTMVFTDFFEDAEPFPTDLRPRLAALADRVVLGSDLPNIPHSYAHQLEA
ncbi:amidohydrolase family protein [Cryobacterium frigoriphilum]|uniref:amidohydrolase family protein n=1 Tax=Cryobacterium frigoriphilum TaxID=1259150 RepID=UPI001F54380A|nr:amidohydrolase family protein [Cryobacterium frigoriphilum]